MTTCSRNSRPTTGSTRYRMVARISCSQFAPRLIRRPLLIRSMALSIIHWLASTAPAAMRCRMSFDVSDSQELIPPSLGSVAVGRSVAQPYWTHLFHTANPAAFSNIATTTARLFALSCSATHADRMSADASRATGMLSPPQGFGSRMKSSDRSPVELVQVGGAVLPGAVDHAAFGLAARGS